MAKRSSIALRALLILTPILILAGVVGFQLYFGPHYKSAANACFNNLRSIDSAKQQWGLEHHASATNTPSWDDLRPYLAHEHILTCPNGGRYTIGRMDQVPTCSYPGDVLP
jgi:hypothetical protein